MRRWLIVLAVVALAVALVALPGAAKEDPEDVVFSGGVSTFGAVVARTGDYAGSYVPPSNPESEWKNLMDPEYNRCVVAEATLKWVGKNTAKLYTTETCPSPQPPTRVKEWDVHITPGGAVKMTRSPDDPNYPALVGGEHWLVGWTGCALNGTFPMYHGSFDGNHLYAVTHYHGICDGGTVWGNAHHDIGKEDGPIHTTYDISLYVTED